MNKRLKNSLIRLLYFIPLIIFIFGFIFSLKDLEYDSSLGLKYKYVFGIPILVFAYQTIRNSIIGWTLVMLLYFVYLWIWIWRLIDQYSLIGAKYTYGQYFSWWILVLIYIGLGLIYFKIRPKRLMI